MAEQLRLPAEPGSVSHARRWVRDRLEERGYLDLVEAATLGVSELVTNALLHVGSPIVVSVEEDHGRPRIGVFDAEPLTGQGASASLTDVPADSTVGRGLQLVEAHALAWGVIARPDGKVVWFEPAGTINHVDAPADLLHAPLVPPTDTDVVPVTLRGVPLSEFVRFQSRLLELIREVQLLALDEGSELSAWARHLARLGAELESGRYLTPESTDRLMRAAVEGAGSVDLVYQVPRRLRAACGHMADLLRSADREAREEQLLVTPADPVEAALRDWYFHEMVRQIDGQAPVPWTAAARSLST